MPAFRYYIEMYGKMDSLEKLDQPDMCGRVLQAS